MGNTQNRLDAPERSSTTKAAATSNEGGDQESRLSSSSQGFTCKICVEPTTTANMFSNNSVCNHPFCLECISMYVRTKVVDDYAADIPCPDLDCDKILDPFVVRHIVPPKVFEKWCDNLCSSAILGLKTCYCPYADCSVLVANECGGIQKKTTCPNCKRLFCFKCKVTWHEGYNCSERPKDDNHQKFLDLAKKKLWKGCPTCGHYVDRIRGCNKVRCRCGSSFCYGCRRTEQHCKCTYNFDTELLWMVPCCIIFGLAMGVFASFFMS